MLRFRLLGPLEVLRDGESCTPTASMQRALLAILLLHANSYLSTRRIIDLLWDGRPPRTASSVLQMYVTAVRRALAPSATWRQGHQKYSMLRTAPSGYGLWLAPGQLDLEQFRALAGRGRRLGPSAGARRPRTRSTGRWRCGAVRR